MNEQDQKLTIIEFLGDVFGIDEQISPEQKLTQIQETLKQVDENTQRSIFAVVRQEITKNGFNSKTRDSNRNKWDESVAKVRKDLGMTSTKMAKLGGILNYINKLNTIR